MPVVSTTQPTAQVLVERAIRALGRLGDGESATSTELSDGLAMLNELIESWNLDRLLIYQDAREEFSLTANRNPHTIGRSVNGSGNGDLVATRPHAIQQASVILSPGNQEYEVDVLNWEEWQAISQKDTTSNIPYSLWYESEFPLGKLWLYPVPTDPVTLVLYVWRQLSSGLELTDKLSVPQGYLRALRFNLAIDLSLDYGVVVSPTLDRLARATKAAVAKANNTGPLLMTPDSRVYPQSQLAGGGYNINTNRFGG